MKNALALIATCLLFACSSQRLTPEPEPQNTLTQCPDQRPQVCTMDYRPVCATRDTGVRCVTVPCASSEQKTYSNACSACTDPAVVGYIANECTPATTP